MFTNEGKYPKHPGDELTALEGETFVPGHPAPQGKAEMKLIGTRKKDTGGNAQFP